MVRALKWHIPEMQFTIPNSGFFIWVRLPGIDINELFLLALEKYKVSFLPGDAFHVQSNDHKSDFLRLSFAFCPSDLIETGIIRLKKAIKELK
ncbi:aminotransferase class I/II-fold pyridoxal phosphate-dependent enzyme [Candidatus Megaera polyxenophila]|uniref:aminotransferase class I/II-fold pyridoxal phosphate-dependent enzyme n=1 Tax=Candidatus Megaera polyxenophila TaxID=988779 RepID=UPI00249EAA4D|nr:aminotransferase class I/II-fold pyridoxal phosphate-dependent enzyme [Candidatus Megaera polyxenophila]